MIQVIKTGDVAKASKQFRLQPFQDKFVYSEKEFPAMISAWGTGKTLCLILRAMIYSQLIPNNLGMIVRREYEDLKDSTVKDFESYTGLKVNSQRDVVLPNKSIIMFRHFEELMSAKEKGHRNLQNINLGWAAIEQAEELESDRAFWLLWGRLRRKVAPVQQFIDLGLPARTIFTIGNVAGDNWVKQLWKDKNTDNNIKLAEIMDKFPLIEATTYDNAKNLDKEFLDNLEIIKVKKPDMFQRFVMNDWAAEVSSMVFRNLENISMDGFIGPDPEHEYILGIDLAKTHDFNVVAVLNRHTHRFDYIARWQKSKWAKTKERILTIAKKYNNAEAFIDATGVGDPIVEDLQRAGLNVFCEKDKENSGIKFNNTNKEQMVDRYAVAIEEAMISWPDPKCIDREEWKETMQQFIKEHKAYKAEVTTTRRIRYSAPSGEHDDCVTAGFLAVWGLFDQMYEKKLQQKKPTKADTFWKLVEADKLRSRNNKAFQEGSEIEISEEGSYTIEG